MVIQYMTAVANEIREILSLLGYHSLQEIIGRTELLAARIPPSRFKISRVNLDRLLYAANLSDSPRRCLEMRNDPPSNGGHLDDQVLERLQFGKETVAPLEMHANITNADRAVGARIAGEIALRYRSCRLPPGTLKVR